MSRAYECHALNVRRAVLARLTIIARTEGEAARAMLRAVAFRDGVHTITVQALATVEEAA